MSEDSSEELPAFSVESRFEAEIEFEDLQPQLVNDAPVQDVELDTEDTEQQIFPSTDSRCLVVPRNSTTHASLQNAIQPSESQIDNEYTIFFVEKTQLLKLKGWCEQCQCVSDVIGTSRQRESVHTLQMKCRGSNHSGSHPSWLTSSKLTNGSFLVNLCVPYLFLLNGLTYSRANTITQSLKAGYFKSSVVAESTKLMLVPTVDAYFKQKMKEEWAKLRAAHQPIDLIFDARYDSPRNATHCSVVFLEKSSKKIVSIVNLEKNWTSGNSNRMETIGVWMGLERLCAELPLLSSVIHDDDNKIHVLLGSKFKELKNLLCVWHKAKRIGKSYQKLQEIKIGRGTLLHPALQSITMSYVKGWFRNAVEDCGSDECQLLQKWYTLPFHLAGRHSLCSPERCKQTQEDSERKHIPYHTFVALSQWCHRNVDSKDASRLAHNTITSIVECFNKFMKKYATKDIFFSTTYGMRIQLAALEWNENIDRPTKTKNYEFIENILKEALNKTANSTFEMEFEENLKQLKEEAMKKDELWFNRDRNENSTPAETGCGCKSKQPCHSKKCSCARQNVGCSDACACKGKCHNTLTKRKEITLKGLCVQYLQNHLKLFWEELYMLPTNLIVDVFKGVAVVPPSTNGAEYQNTPSQLAECMEIDEIVPLANISKKKQKLEEIDDLPAESSYEIELEWLTETAGKNFHSQMRDLPDKRTRKRRSFE